MMQHRRGWLHFADVLLKVQSSAVKSTFVGIPQPSKVDVFPPAKSLHPRLRQTSHPQNQPLTTVDFGPPKMFRLEH
jgi:hypothetical protein